MPKIPLLGLFSGAKELFSDNAQPTSYLEPQFKPHYEAWKANPTPETAGNLLRAADPVINEAIRTYGAGSVGSPTLKSKAKKLTLQALKSYDPTRAKFRTHMLSQLQGLRRMAAKEEQIISTPEQVLLDAGSLRESENALRDKLGREPSDMELADYASLSKKRIGYIRNLRPSIAEGRLTRIDDEGTSLSAPAVEQDIPTKTMDKWHEFVHDDLAPTDQLIMAHSLGMFGRPILTNQEIARKLRLSPGAVSQRKAKIQEAMDSYNLTGLF